MPGMQFLKICNRSSFVVVSMEKSNFPAECSQNLISIAHFTNFNFYIRLNDPLSRIISLPIFVLKTGQKMPK